MVSKKTLSKAIHALNSWYLSQSKSILDGTTDSRASALMITLSCVVIKSNTAHIFHVGDSRIHQLRGSQLEQLTQDHIGPQPGLANQLQQALGLNERLGPDYFKTSVKPGDRFLLTTDGVHQNLSHKTLTSLSAVSTENSLRVGSLQTCSV